MHSIVLQPKFIGLNYALSIVLQPELKGLNFARSIVLQQTPQRMELMFSFCMLRFEKPKPVSDIANLRSIIRVAQLIAVSVVPVSLPNRIPHKSVVRFSA